MQIKLKPAPNARVCNKCGGTGFYCMGTINDQPYSHTGFDCHPCHGTGWKLPKGQKRVRKVACPTCGLRLELGEPHGFMKRCDDGAWRTDPCKGWD